MVPVRLLVELRCEDYDVWLFRDVCLPVIFPEMVIDGLGVDEEFDGKVEGLTCDVRRPFALAVLPMHTFREDDQRDLPPALRASEVKEDIIDWYLSRGWQVAEVDPFGEFPELPLESRDEFGIPWSGPSLA